MKRGSALLIILALTGPALADTKVVGHMEPLPHELLEQPIVLKDHCKGITVVEWRSTSGRQGTKPSKTGEKALNEICNLALSKIESFAINNGYKADAKINIKISLMPADIRLEGRDYRNLNDKLYRFKYRDRQDVQYIWGYASDSGHLYIRNDILNDYSNEVNLAFKLVFTHELWHMYSFQSGIYYQLDDNDEGRAIKDEHMAQSFTEYLGFGRF